MSAVNYVLTVVYWLIKKNDHAFGARHLHPQDYPGKLIYWFSRRRTMFLYFNVFNCYRVACEYIKSLSIKGQPFSIVNLYNFTEQNKPNPQTWFVLFVGMLPLIFYKEPTSCGEFNSTQNIHTSKIYLIFKHNII